MLPKVKSSNAIKSNFCRLDDEGKLKLILYNKRIQNIININLKNYKIISRKYIIFEDNGN